MKKSTFSEPVLAIITDMLILLLLVIEIDIRGKKM